jgi:curved DNA-binding protein CbpA
MGNNLSLAAQIPEAHVRIYRNILQIQSPQTRLQMLETVLSGPEYVASIKQAGLYGPVLSYISAIRRGDPAILPGEQSRATQQQVQHYSDGGQGRPQNVFTQPARVAQQNQVIHHSGDPGAHTKAITFFSQCLQILGLEEEVALSEDVLKVAYKKASLRAHPDKGGSEKAFDEVTRAYAYLGEILRRVRGGRTEMVNVTEESPARLAAAREDKSEAWKLNEPVKLNPKSLNMDVFNKVFEETRLPDPDGDGYGDWLKDPSSQGSNQQNKFNGKFNRSVFNEAFEGEIKSRAMNQNSRAVAMRQPQALVMAPTMGIELGRERPDDFTGANLSGLKYTDLRKAYTEESTFSHQVSDVQVSNKSFDAAASERKAAPRPLSAEEMESVQEGERYMAQRQAQQATRISQEDRRISEHFERMKRYVLTDK